MSPVWAAAASGFVAALVASLITAYVALYVRTAGAGRRLVEATIGREIAERELVEYEEAVHSWQHYARALQEQLDDSRASVNHLSERLSDMRRRWPTPTDLLVDQELRLDPDDAGVQLPCLPTTPQPTVEEEIT